MWDPNATSIYVFLTPEEVAMSKQMQYFWTNFAETGNPNKGRNENKLLFNWLSYESNTKQNTLQMNNVSTTNGMIIANAPDASICDLECLECLNDFRWNNTID